MVDRADADPTVRIRMYRQGLGDCHLVTVLRGGEPVFRLMIDCGVYQTVKGGAARMREIVADVIAETGGRVDVLAVTHEHWDHVSGFNQARSLFAVAGEADAEGKLSVGEVWLGWTEDEADPVASRISMERGAAIRAVASAMGVAAAAEGGAELRRGLAGVLGFFGGAARTTADAMKSVKSLAPAPRYCRPTDPPRELVPGVRAYVLGPPIDPRRIYKLVDDDETYGIVRSRADRALMAAVEAVDLQTPATWDEGQPFDWTFRRSAPFLVRDDGAGRAPPPGPDSPTDAFLSERYVGHSPTAPGDEQAWRRIDADWLDPARDFALRLDNATNNTSLVLALELEATGRVLLFVADAQVGSWMSWLELEWVIDGRRVTGPDLLSRTVFMKVGHHGSHNATLRQKGLETVAGDFVAFIPTDEEMAKKVGWGRMPLPSLVRALEERTGGRVVRADREYVAPPNSTSARRFGDVLKRTDLYYEMDF